MTKEQIWEIKDFLVFLHLKVVQCTEGLSKEDFSDLVDLEKENPQFENIRRENIKIFKWLDEEKIK